MKLKGNLSIISAQGTHRGGYISLRITDELSHCRIVEVEIDYAEWGKAIAGFGNQPCLIDYNSDAPFGKQREFKTLSVPYLRKIGVMHSKEDAAKALAPFETDGWKGFIDDYLNGNRAERRDDGTEYRKVGFVRFVDPDKATDAEGA